MAETTGHTGATETAAARRRPGYVFGVAILIGLLGGLLLADAAVPLGQHSHEGGAIRNVMPSQRPRVWVKGLVSMVIQ